MASLSPIDRLLEQPLFYRAWQKPFAERKLAVIEPRAILEATRVLDVGCGPGTNARHFEHAEYTGLDLNPKYIAKARDSQKGTFIVGDAANLQLSGTFDFILVNSLYHHLDDEQTNTSLQSLARHLDPTGRIHVLDLVLPDRPGVAAALARWDRGDFPRVLSHWRTLLFHHFTGEHFEPYRLDCFGLTLWQMVYFRGRLA